LSPSATGVLLLPGALSLLSIEPPYADCCCSPWPSSPPALLPLLLLAPLLPLLLLAVCLMSFAALRAVCFLPSLLPCRTSYQHNTCSDAQNYVSKHVKPVAEKSLEQRQPISDACFDALPVLRCCTCDAV
jgi:hypothetical protein